MLDLNILKKSWYFKEIILEKWEVLFNEWENDNNIYIVIHWELLVEKYTTKQKNETKVLASLKDNDIFWEAALNSDKPKEVNIVAKRKSILIWINAKEWLSEFLKKIPNEALTLLKYIIHLWNQRLSESNYLITASYKISKEIIELNEINMKNIFQLIEVLKNSIWVSEILYYEVNPVMNNYLTLKYDTRNKWKLLNEIIEITNNKLDLLSLQIDHYYKFIQKLSIWNSDMWYLVFLKKGKIFNESDKKIITTTATSISWLIKQKQILDEQRDKEFMEE